MNHLNLSIQPVRAQNSLCVPRSSVPEESYRKGWHLFLWNARSQLKLFPPEQAQCSPLPLHLVAALLIAVALSATLHLVAALLIAAKALRYRSTSSLHSSLPLRSPFLRHSTPSLRSTNPTARGPLLTHHRNILPPGVNSTCVFILFDRGGFSLRGETVNLHH